ncbi:ImmA/IrrE family metallo-endopeptidase [Peptococcaceae bacterium 1198_IL3148]
MSKRAIKKAISLYYTFKEESITPLDIDGIIEQVGVELIPWNFPDHIRGCLMHDNDYTYMGINKKHLVSYPNLARFTKAHELGHYYLHDDKRYYCVEDLMKSATKKNNPIEWEANTFAAELLMPGTLMKKLYKDMTTKELSIYFKVSKESIIYRLNNLGLI